MALLCLCTVAASYTQEKSVSSQVNSYRIAGTVISTLTGSPLGHARVTLSDTNNREQTVSVVTAEDGRFQFNQLYRGKFSLHCAKRGFISSDYLAHEQYSTAIVTGAGIDTEHLTFRIAPYAILSGKVLDEAGDPVRDATVSLFRENHNLGESRIMRFRSASTDDLGAYEFANLNAGTYFLSVRATPWYAVHPASSRKTNENSATFEVDPSLDVAYPITYYADSTEPDDATPIPLRGGDHPEVEIHLNPVPALHLQFQIPGDPSRGYAVPMLEQPSFDGLESVPNVLVHQVSQGSFEITGVAPGHYTARIPAPSGSAFSTVQTEVDVTSNDQKLESSAADASGSVKATVEVAGESTVPSNLSLALRNDKMRIVSWQEVDAKGEVTFENVAPGRYEVLVQGPGKRYSVLRILSSGTESQGHYLNVGSGSAASVSIYAVGGAVRVEGVAERAKKPVAGAMVVLAPEHPESNRQLFRRDQTDLDGSFTLMSVIPGAYSVCAIEDGWDLDWAKPAVIAHYCEHGEKIVVREGSSGSMHLQRSVEMQPR